MCIFVVLTLIICPMSMTYLEHSQNDCDHVLFTHILIMSIFPSFSEVKMFTYYVLMISLPIPMYDEN